MVTQHIRHAMVGTGLAAVVLLPVGTLPATAATTADVQREFTTAVAHYTLGDEVFAPDGFKTGTSGELTGIVHYPTNTGGEPKPLIMMLHGYWETCADKSNDGFSWPCPAGVKQIKSYRGYDYLGEALAKRGYTVVSISANGVNANSQDSMPDRSALVDKHLELWKQLTAGTGPLVGKFTDGTSGKPVKADFKNAVDWARVGTLGHSRGGGGVLNQASDEWRAAKPGGVRPKAVFALAPAAFAVPDFPTITGSPVGIMLATCDSLYSEGDNAFSEVTPKDREPSYRFSVRGANHNFFNTQWSPDGGQAHAKDDATVNPDGTCTQGDGSHVPQLKPGPERQVLTAYATAFYDRHLMDAVPDERILTGAGTPVQGIATVDVTHRVPIDRVTGPVTPTAAIALTPVKGPPLAPVVPPVKPSVKPSAKPMAKPSPRPSKTSKRPTVPAPSRVTRITHTPTAAAARPAPPLAATGGPDFSGWVTAAALLIAAGSGLVFVGYRRR